MKKRYVAWAVLLAALAGSVRAETPALQIDREKVTAKVSPTLYGLMTEEINFSYDGGLYGELVRNRAMKDNPNEPIRWSIVQPEGGTAAITLDLTQPLSPQLVPSLKLDATSLEGQKRIGVANEGYWGIPVHPGTTYRATFYAKTSANFDAPLTVSIESNDGKTVYAQGTAASVGGDWKQYTVLLKTGQVTPTAAARLVISTEKAGILWFNLVSLFGPTYNQRPNGNRIDIMEKLVDLKPTFLRFPGGNYVEGDTMEERFDWKKTIHSLAERPGHQSPWKYRSTDGMGLLEFLQWTEDMHAEPVLAVFAGYVLRRQHIAPGPLLQPTVQEALDEIEYVMGDKTTYWGAQRAADGHPEPFKLRYVEVGNEDFFDRSGSYEGRFAQFYDAIKAKYPQLQVIATTPVKSRVPDLVDEHYYYRSTVEAQKAAHRYDKRERTGPKVFVGEWATREGSPTTNLSAALGDAAFMTGMERNSDLVVMSCYAPLFVNVNPGGMQWRSNLIGYDTLTSYGSPSYYAQKMFSTYLGDTVVDASLTNVPASETGVEQLYTCVTRDSKKGALYLKVVNVSGVPQGVDISLKGKGTVAPEGTLVVLTSADPKDTNTITEPAKIMPVVSKLTGAGAKFTHTFPPYSISVLQIESK